MSSKVKEFRDMNEGQLKDKITELRLELIKQNAQIATGTTPKSPGLVRETKRNIARILTILKSKQKPKVSDKKVSKKATEDKSSEVKPKAKPPVKPKKKVVKKQEGVDKKV